MLIERVRDKQCLCRQSIILWPGHSRLGTHPSPHDPSNRIHALLPNNLRRFDAPHKSLHRLHPFRNHRPPPLPLAVIRHARSRHHHGRRGNLRLSDILLTYESVLEPFAGHLW